MFEFHPKRLTEVLKKVRENHADRRGCAPEIGKSVVDEVREILSQAETKDLNNIIFRFDSKRLLACIEIVAVDREGDVADKAAHAVRMRPKEAMIPIAWFKLLNKYPPLFAGVSVKGPCYRKGWQGHRKQPKYI